MINNTTEETPQQRLQRYIDKYYKSSRQFAETIGMRGDAINKYLGEKASKIGEKHIPALLKLGFNYLWYITGEGEMTIPYPPILDNEEKPIINGYHKGVPYFSMDVTGSLVRSFSDIQEAPEFYVDFKPLNDCTAYLTVYGDSMFPKYCSGDIVAVKKFNNCDTLLWGEAYMIITDEEANCLRTIKLIHQHPENDKIILRASNPNYPGDTIISKKNIVNIFIVKGKIKLEQF